jgi:hypothetical protein
MVFYIAVLDLSGITILFYSILGLLEDFGSLLERLSEPG